MAGNDGDLGDPSSVALDLNADDREAEVKRLTELGATIVETKTESTGHVTEFGR